MRDIEIIKRELPLDILQFSCLTPLPGSEDHAKAVKAGADIDEDLNKFDLEHVVCDHPRMSRAEWQHAYHLAWKTYYTDDHMKTVIRRAGAGGARVDTVAFLMCVFWASSQLYNIYPLEAGLIRRKVRTDRRPGMRIEHPLVFYPRIAWEQASVFGQTAAKLLKLWRFARTVQRDPNAKTYSDAALTEASSGYDSLEMFQLSDSAKAAGAKAKRIEEHKHAAPERVEAPADAAE